MTERTTRRHEQSNDYKSYAETREVELYKEMLRNGDREKALKICNELIEEKEMKKSLKKDKGKWH